MKRRNATRSALFTSIISLLLCVSMLVGTTFAWFTDSVVSGNNVIAAGNLDVEVFNALGIDESKKVTTNTQLFDEITYWEPGVVAFENITVANMGSLALKYQLSVNFDNATENANGDTLAKVLKVGFVEGGISGYSDDNAGRTALVNKLTSENAWQALESFVQPGALDAVNKDLTAANTSDTYGIVIYWEPSTIDNEFNMNNENKGKVMSIDLGIALVATQLEAELDSFGSDYDKDAVYGDHYATDAFELQNALDNAEEGEVIVLMEDIDLSGNSKARAATDDFALTVPAGKNVILNLNGNTISRTSSVSDINGDGAYTSADNQGIFRVKGVMTVVGQGTIAMQNTGGNMEWNALSACFSIEGGDLTLGEGVTVIHRGGTDMAYAVDVNTSGAPSTLTVDGAILSSSYTAVRLFNFSNHLATVNVNSGVISGAKRDIWKQSTGANSVNIAVPYTEENGIYTIGDANVSVPSNSATLKTAVAAAGATVNVPAGEYTFPSSFAEGVTLNCAPGTVFEGKSGMNINGATVVGATFSNPDDVAGAGTINGTFKNCVFEGSEALRWCYAGETVVFENCEFKTDFRGVHFDGMDHDVIFRNCKINGFNAFGGTATVTFEGCTFGCDESRYNGLNMYCNTVLTDCKFEFITGKTNFIDFEEAGHTLTITNCTATLDGETANVLDFVGGTYKDQTTIIARETTTTEDGLVLSADCVTGTVALYDTADYTGDTLEVPAGVQAIGNFAFSSNTAIETVVLPTTVTDLGRGFDTSTVKKVVLNEGLETISSRAFRSTTALEEVEISSTVKTIADDAFQKTGLKTITIPATVEYVGAQAFGASKINTVIFEGNTTIQNKAFRGCADLRTVYLNGDDITFENTTGQGNCWFCNSESNNPNVSNITFYVKNELVASKVKAAMGAEAANTPVYVNGVLYEG